MKITPDMKKQAVEAAMTGVNPVEFLKGQNVKAPGTVWYHIREWLKKTNMEAYLQLPEAFKANLSKPKDQLPVVKLTGPIRIETPEANKVEVVEKPARKKKLEYKITGIQTEIGDFQYFKKVGYIDWTFADNPTVSLNLGEWAALMEIFPRVKEILEAPDNDE